MHKTHKKYRSLIKKTVSLTSITKNNFKTIEPFKTFNGFSLKEKKACLRQQEHSPFHVDGIFESEKNNNIQLRQKKYCISLWSNQN